MDPLAAVDAVQNFNLLPSFISLKSIRDDEKLFLAVVVSQKLEKLTQKVRILYHELTKIVSTFSKVFCLPN